MSLMDKRPLQLSVATDHGDSPDLGIRHLMHRCPKVIFYSARHRTIGDAVEETDRTIRFGCSAEFVVRQQLGVILVVERRPPF